MAFLKRFPRKNKLARINRTAIAPAAPTPPAAVDPPQRRNALGGKLRLLRMIGRTL